MNTRLSRVFSHLQCSNISPKTSIVDRQSAINRLKHSNVCESAETEKKEEKLVLYIPTYVVGLVSLPFNN